MLQVLKMLGIWYLLDILGFGVLLLFRRSLKDSPRCILYLLIISCLSLLIALQIVYF